MRAVLYLRLSEQDDASTGIARQEADLRARAEREGWQVVRVLVDDGISGRRSRANADAALQMLADREADVLAVWKFDRWSRQGLGALSRLIEVLDERPGTLFIADRDGLSSEQPAWRIIASVLAEVARMEVENTQARVRSSIEALRKARRFAGGTVPFGYTTAEQPDGPGRVLVADPEEALVVEEAAERLLGGEALWAVCADFNARGIPAPRSEFRRLKRAGKETDDASRGVWRVQSLRRTMTSSHLLGRVTHRGEILRDDRGLPLTVWEPLLTPETLSRLRADLLPPAGPVRPREARSRPLSGLLHCASCGSRLYVRTSNGRPLYGCPSSRNGAVCPSPRVQAESLERYVESEARARLFDFRLSETVIVSGDPSALIDVEESLQAASAALLKDDADVPAILARIEALKARRATLRDSTGPKTLHTLREGPLWTDAYDAATDDDRRRELLSVGIERVLLSPMRRRTNVLDPERVEIRWREDLD